MQMCLVFFLCIFQSSTDSFNMNLSTEASIETLPEYANGTNVVDMNVINDQTIANFCSDTVRELNSLTEELQHSDLDETIRHHNHENQTSFTNMNSKLNDDSQVETANNGIQDAVHETSIHGSVDENHRSSINDHNLMVSYYNRTMLNGQSSDSNENNTNCDDVDSSPYYRHFNAHLENHLDDANEIKSRISINNSHHSQNDTYPYANGRMSTNESNDADYRMPICMLQSVDLRGNVHSHKINLLSMSY